MVKHHFVKIATNVTNLIIPFQFFFENVVKIKIANFNPVRVENCRYTNFLQLFKENQMHSNEKQHHDQKIDFQNIKQLSEKQIHR